MKYFTTLFIFFSVFSNCLYSYEQRYIEVNSGIAFEASYWGVWRRSLEKANVFYWTDGNGSIVAPLYESTKFKDGDVLEGNPGFRQIRMPYASGIRAALRLSPDSAQSIEFIFEGLLRWKVEKLVCVNLPALAIPTDRIKKHDCTDPISTHDWMGFDSGKYTYTSRFDSFEIAYWYHETPQRVDYFSFSWLAGLRMINFAESIDISNCQFLSCYLVRVKNLPLGIEAGFDFQNNPWGRFSWLVRARAGIYANWIEKKVYLTDNSFEVVKDHYYYKLQDTYLVEATPELIYRLKPFYFTLAYNFLGLYNVALAPFQIHEGTPIRRIGSKKSLTLNSFQVGFGFYF